MTRFSFNHLKLRNKFLLLYVLAVLVPVVLTNLFFYQVMTERVYQQKIRDVHLTFAQIKREFQQLVDDAVGSTVVLYTDGRLAFYLDQEYEHLSEYIRVYDQYLRGLLSKHGPIYHAVYSIAIYTDNPTLLYAGGVYRLDEDVRRETWYEALAEHPQGQPVLIPLSASGQHTFSVVRKLDLFRAYNRWEKILKIDLNMDTVDHLLSNVTFPGTIHLLDPSRRVQFSTDPDWEPRAEGIIWDEETYQEAFPGQLLLVEQLHDREYMHGWELVGVVEKGELLEEVKASGRFIFYLAGLNLLLATLIITAITRSLHRRLLQVVRYLRKVKNQEFVTMDTKEAGYRDEIGEIVREFNRMSRQIKRLINDVYVADLQKKDMELKQKQAQLRALQSQINPHFLFNALETIRMRSLLKEEQVTADMIGHLAKILKKTFIWGNHWVRLEEELELVDSFLELQQYRYEHHLTCLTELDEGVAQVLIPSMILVPFVENACIHGIKPAQQGGTIRITARREEEWLVLTVEDDGVGMDQEELNRIRQSLTTADDVGENVGIKNVYLRLYMHYADRFRLVIDSEPGRGTIITLRIPAKAGKS